MCTRVTKGFDGAKFSGSLKMCGSFRVSTVRAIMAIADPKMSFTVKIGVEWNFICIFV